MKSVYLLFALLVIGTAAQDSGCGNPRYHLGYNGTFESMNFDPAAQSRYDANAFCQWNLETSEAQNMAMEIEFGYMSVEASINCNYDSVTVYEGLDDTGPVLAILCGHNIPTKVISHSYLLYITFTSDGSIQHFGFNATWKSRDAPVECDEGIDFRCGNDETGFCISADRRCDGTEDCALGEDEVGCPVSSDTCGKPAIPPNTNSTSIAVTGGTEAIPGSWPWLVGVQDAYKDHICGGAIINERWVMTAASCVYFQRDQPSLINVLVGNHDYEERETHEHSHNLWDIYIHPSFSLLKLDYNFALLKTKSKIVFSDTVSDICVIPGGIQHPNGTKAWFAGWGYTNPSVQAFGSSVVMQAEMTIYHDDFCNDPSRYDGTVGAGEMCAGSLDGSVGACEGDDGGPLVWYNDDPTIGQVKWYILAVAGARNEETCGVPNMPGLYGEIQDVTSWINETLYYN
ncbi:chymotrypsinogen A-like [Saccoglossus kowalevskii]|uniref:Transmembrane protease serine 5-like n=1 Tax=Saccoglossus kowalevskii TaxID=10224 RepID=A0ABM0MCS9_SACKO|nr:PREDICTED: transmembrane protease serine 5-like [Saccoglossus kowalevskii]